jgi:integrase
MLDWDSIRESDSAIKVELANWKKGKGKEASKLSEGCLKSYQAHWKTLVKNKYAFSENFGTLRQEKNAFRFVLRNEIKKLMGNSELNKSNQEYSFELKKKAIKTFDLLMHLEKSVDDYIEKHTVKRFTDSNGVEQRVTDLTKRKSKRDPILAIARNNENWQIDSFNKIDNPKVKEAWALLMVTGCRPDELAKGIQIKVRDDGNILFDILTSKSDKGVFRQLNLEILDPDLKKFLSQYDGKTVKPYERVNTLTVAMKREGEKLGLKDFSSYSHRHVMASVLKKQFGEDGDEVSQFLGHACTGSKIRYGSIRYSGKSAIKPSDVITNQKISSRRALKARPASMSSQQPSVPRFR